MQRFVRDFAITPETRVLDIGGTAYNWTLLAERPRLTLLNMPRASEVNEQGVDWVAADGCALPFGDASFDVVFSNSVIEHLGSPERQRQFASEVARVGKKYYVQTPNRWFFRRGLTMPWGPYSDPYFELKKIDIHATVKPCHTPELNRSGLTLLHTPLRCAD